MRVERNQISVSETKGMAYPVAQLGKHGNKNTNNIVYDESDRFVHVRHFENYNNYSKAEVEISRKLSFAAKNIDVSVSNESEPSLPPCSRVPLLWVSGSPGVYSGEALKAISDFEAYYKPREITPDMTDTAAKIAQLMNQLISDKDYIEKYIKQGNIATSEIGGQPKLSEITAWVELEHQLIFNADADTKEALAKFLACGGEYWGRGYQAIDIDYMLSHGTVAERASLSAAYQSFLVAKAWTEGLTDAERLVYPGAVEIERGFGPWVPLTTSAKTAAEYVDVYYEMHKDIPPEVMEYYKMWNAELYNKYTGVVGIKDEESLSVTYSVQQDSIEDKIRSFLSKLKERDSTQWWNRSDRDAGKIRHQKEPSEQTKDEWLKYIEFLRMKFSSIEYNIDRHLPPS